MEKFTRRRLTRSAISHIVHLGLGLGLSYVLGCGSAGSNNEPVFPNPPNFTEVTMKIPVGKQSDFYLQASCLEGTYYYNISTNNIPDDSWMNQFDGHVHIGAYLTSGNGDAIFVANNNFTNERKYLCTQFAVDVPIETVASKSAEVQTLNDMVQSSGSPNFDGVRVIKAIGEDLEMRISAEPVGSSGPINLNADISEWPSGSTWNPNGKEVYLYFSGASSLGQYSATITATDTSNGESSSFVTTVDVQ